MRRVLAVVTSFTIGLGSSFSTAVLSAQHATPNAPERPAASPFAPDAIRRAVMATIASDPQAQDADKKWAKVIGIRSGAEQTVTVAGGTPTTRIVLGADESSLTLMVNDESLPIEARDALRDMASLNPKRLISLKDAGSYTDRERQVRFSPDGVFVRERKVASLGDLIIRVDRHDVVEIRRSSAKAFRIIGGFFAGYIGFGYAAQEITKANGHPSEAAAILSGLVGGVGLAIWFNHLGSAVIYRR